MRLGEAGSYRFLKLAPERARVRRVLDQLADRPGERVRILRRHQKAAVFVANNLLHAANARCDGRDASIPGFDECIRKRFRARWRQEDIESRKKRCRILLEADKEYAVRESKALRELLQAFAFRSFADNVECDIRMAVLQIRKRVQGVGNSLRRMQFREHADTRAFHGRW